jgi:hypothetical protein
MTDADLYPRAVAAVRMSRVAAPSLLCEQFGCGVTQASRLLDLMVENRLGVLRRSFRGSLFEYHEGVADELDYRGPRVQQALPLGDLPPSGDVPVAVARSSSHTSTAKRSRAIEDDDARRFAEHLRPVIDGIAANDQERRLSRSVLTALYLCLTENDVEIANESAPGLALSDTRF